MVALEHAGGRLMPALATILTGLLIAGVWFAAGLAVLFHLSRETDR